jgi:hypothetical protein
MCLSARRRKYTCGAVYDSGSIVGQPCESIATLVDGAKHESETARRRGKRITFFMSAPLFTC